MADPNSPETPPVLDPSTPAAWHNGVAPELLGALQTRGWDKLSADDAAKTIAKSYRDLELFRGVPAERLLKLPEKIDGENLKPILERIGMAPPEKYDFEGVKLEDGMKTLLSERAAGLGLTQSAAKGVAELVSTIADQIVGDQQKEVQQSAAEAGAELDRLWGNAKTQNMIMAKNAAAAAGASPEEVEAMQKSLGYVKTLEFFRRLAVKTGEDKLLGADIGVTTGPMSAEQARARREELMADPAIRTDKKLQKELFNMNRVITGVTDAW